jgi:hypothetical protein
MPIFRAPMEATAPNKGIATITARGARPRSRSCCLMPAPTKQDVGTIQLVQSMSPKNRRNLVHEYHDSGRPMAYVLSSAAITWTKTKNSFSFAIAPTSRQNLLK